MSDITRLRQLKEAGDTEAARDLALLMLSKSRRREIVDAALTALDDDVPESARPTLRDLALYYFDTPNNDKTVAAREKLLRMLTHIGDPADIDLYLRGVNAYEKQPFLGEVAQNLRAVSLVGLALADMPLGNLYAVKLLSGIDDATGDVVTSVFNGEPAVTAVNLLARQGIVLPIYQYLLLAGLDALEMGLNEVVGKALESLGEDFPINLYQPLIDLFVPRDRALVSIGIISHIVEHKLDALYPAIETIITTTRHHDLHNYAVVMLAASRDTALMDILFTLAKLSPQHRIDNFIAALELVPGSEKDELLEQLNKRL
jgi:hypothetical protein